MPGGAATALEPENSQDQRKSASLAMEAAKTLVISLAPSVVEAATTNPNWPNRASGAAGADRCNYGKATSQGKWKRLWWRSWRRFPETSWNRRP